MGDKYACCGFQRIAPKKFDDPLPDGGLRIVLLCIHDESHPPFPVKTTSYNISLPLLEISRLTARAILSISNHRTYERFAVRKGGSQMVNSSPPIVEGLQKYGSIGPATNCNQDSTMTPPRRKSSSGTDASGAWEFSSYRCSGLNRLCQIRHNRNMHLV